MRILIIEDDKDLCALMALNLEGEGYTVDTCQEGDDGLRIMRERAHDLVLLDRMLPRLDGLTLLKTARQEGISTPVLIITALGSLPQVVEGLDCGADDYLEKPFAVDELLARIRAICRRPRGIELADVVTCKSTRLDLGNKRLVHGSKSTALSKRESDLLEILMKNFGKTLPRSTIFSYVWGAHAEVEDGNLDNYIHYARCRLSEAESSLVIKTIRGVGYRMEDGHV